MMIDVSRGGAVWSARVAHNHKVAGSNPAPATREKASVQKDWGFFFAARTKFKPATTSIGPVTLIHQKPTLCFHGKCTQCYNQHTMLEYSPLSLTATGKQRLTADTPLQQAIEKIMVNSYDFDSPLEWAMSHGYSEDGFTEHYQNFCHELLPRLPLADQIRSGHNANLRDDNEPTLERPSGIISVASDGLFDGPNVVTHLPETYVSRLVLSGAAALELLRVDPDVVLDQQGQATLDTCRFAGAALATCLQREQTGSHIATVRLPI